MGPTYFAKSIPLGQISAKHQGATLIQISKDLFLTALPGSTLCSESFIQA
jgi:hypothetical protein